MKRYANSIKMRLICPIFIVLLMLSACSGNADRERLEKIVEKWQGKEIVLPDVMTDFLTGDTIDLSDADFTILSYVDSAGCTGCKMKLSLWKNYLNSLDSLGDSDVRFLMIVNTQDDAELRKVLSTYAFEHPLAIDSEGSIGTSNGFTDEMQFQTFLLDGKHNVMAIGSPVGGSDIAAMYNSIISGKMAISPDATSAVSVSDNTVRLGRLAANTPATRTLSFSNMGNDIVRIAKIESSCECTDITFPRDFLPPASKIEATIHFKGDTIPGEFERTIHVYYSGMDYPTVINVTGDIFY